MAEVIFFLNDNVIQLTGLKDEVTGNDIDDATVTVTLLDSTGAEVTGDSWPLSMAPFGAGGIYRATLIDTLGVTLLDNYVAVIDVSKTGIKAKWSIPAQVTLREE